MIKYARALWSASMSAHRITTILVVLVLGGAPSVAQSPGNPFAGRPSGGLGPYGNDTGAAVHLMQAAPAMTIGAPAVVTTTSALAAEESPEMPHRAEIREGTPLWEAMFVGCSAGAFLGGYTAWSATTPVVGAELVAIGAPAAGYVTATLGTASAIGCGLGAATATVSIAAGSLWSWAFR